MTLLRRCSRVGTTASRLSGIPESIGARFVDIRSILPTGGTIAAKRDLDQLEATNFEAVYRSHFVAVYAFCASRVGANNAADATQDAFLRVLTAIDRLPQDAARHRFWVIDRARDACKAVHRSEQRQQRIVARLGLARRVSSPDPARRVEAIDGLERLLRDVGAKSPVDVDVMLLRARGYSSSETADLLGVSVGAVDSRLSRIRARLGKAAVMLIEHQEAP